MGVAGQGTALAWRRNALSYATRSASRKSWYLSRSRILVQRRRISATPTANRAEIYSRLDSRTSSFVWSPKYENRGGRSLVWIARRALPMARSVDPLGRAPDRFDPRLVHSRPGVLFDCIGRLHAARSRLGLG